MFRMLNPTGDTPRVISEVVNGVLNGKINPIGTFTLSSGTNESTIYDERLSYTSVILLTPRTLNAANEMTHLFVRDKNKGNFVLEHRNVSHNDLTFDYVLLG